MKQKKQAERKKTGPKEQRLKLRGDWQGLIGKALAKKRPKKGKRLAQRFCGREGEVMGWSDTSPQETVVAKLRAVALGL